MTATERAKQVLLAWLAKFMTALGLQDWLARFNLNNHPGVVPNAGPPQAVRQPIVGRYAKGPFVLSPTGDTVDFDTSNVAGAEKFVLDMIELIFSQLGIVKGYIPRELTRLLTPTTTPGAAFEQFCAAYGLNVEALGRFTKTGSGAAERDLFEQVVGLLLDFELLEKGIDRAQHGVFFMALKQRQYANAEIMITVARIVSDIIVKAKQDGGTVIFPEYEHLLKELVPFEKNLLGLRPDRALEIQSRTHALIEAQYRLDASLAEINSRLGWCLDPTAWPQNQWGTDNEPVRDGLRNDKETVEYALGTEDAATIASAISAIVGIVGFDANSGLGAAKAAAGQFDIDEAIAALEVIKDDLGTLIAQAQDSQGQGAGGYTASNFAQASAQATWNAWLEAALFLGFAETDNPTEAEIKSAFRKAAMKHHPDRGGDRALFEKSDQSRQILDEGKPAKPTN